MDSSSSSSPTKSKVIQTNNTNNVFTINEKVNLTKNQHEVLQMICNSYQMTVSEYMQEALVEAMRFDIEEGNFSDVLLEKLDEGNKRKNDNSTKPSSMKDELSMKDGLDKLRGQMP